MELAQAQAKLVAADAAQDDEFGNNVALYGDYALVGAHLHDGTGSDSGAAPPDAPASGGDSSTPTVRHAPYTAHDTLLGGCARSRRRARRVQRGAT